MGLGESAKIVGAQALLFEEFVAREAKAGRFAVSLKAADAPILLHGHCHQKAFGAVGPILDVLRLIPGAKPELIESSCCGMAGSFGYDAQHYDVSMQMGRAVAAARGAQASPMRSSSRTGRVAGTRSRTARNGRRSTWRC